MRLGPFALLYHKFAKVDDPRAVSSCPKPNYMSRAVYEYDYLGQARRGVRGRLCTAFVQSGSRFGIKPYGEEGVGGGARRNVSSSHRWNEEHEPLPIGRSQPSTYAHPGQDYEGHHGTMCTTQDGRSTTSTAVLASTSPLPRVQSSLLVARTL